MLSAKHLPLALLLALLPKFIEAQTGAIRGRVLELSNNESLPGATVSILGRTLGTVTNIDGQYEIQKVPAGSCQVVCSYISFKNDTLTLQVPANGVVEANFNLRPDATALAVVVISAKVEKASVGNLIALTRKSVSTISGIAQEDIRRSPDRSTKDVLKRVSGASIQENKFLIVRGLADRYNMPLLNGGLVPSTETDRRAFAFDLLPSALVDNIIVSKTASPDLPSEFAGGVVNVSTKEILERKFLQFSLGTGFNTLSTGRAYRFHEKGKTDWLGFDDGSRALPKDIPATATFEQVSGDFEARYPLAQKFKNDWAIREHSAMSAPVSAQLSGATNFRLGENRSLGLVGGLTWSHAPGLAGQRRSDFSGTSGNLQQEYLYDDLVYSFTTLWGGLANLALQINPKHRVVFNNTFSVNSIDKLIEREGENFINARFDRATSDYFNSNTLYSTQVRSEHFIGRMKLDWNGSFNRASRSTPSYRQMFYALNLDDTTNLYKAYVTPNTPSPNFGGRIYSEQLERLYSTGVDLTVPLTRAAPDPEVDPAKLKIGGSYTRNARTFDNRWFGYVISSLDYEPALLEKPLGEIFEPENLRPGGFYVREGTRGTDSYTASSSTLAGYFRTDFVVDDIIHVSAGLRLEHFEQHLESLDGSTPVIVDTSVLSILPSFNVFMVLDQEEKHRVRFAASRTISRPNFRELAPFVFWDFDLQAGIYGEPLLVNTLITNIDLRYEFFPAGNQMLFFGGFYKSFDKPVEQFSDAGGGGSRRYGFLNTESAECFGVELEYRYKPVRGLTLFGNVALIQSEVGFTRKQAKAGFLPRPLQGQSPYVVNLGATVATKDDRATLTALFNQIGRRIWLVGQNSNYPSTYEAPRPVLDFTLTYKFNDRFDAKVTASDVLRRNYVFYIDIDDSGKYEEANDAFIRSIEAPAVFGLTLNYRL